MYSSLSYIFPFPYLFSESTSADVRAFAYTQPSGTTLLIALSFIFFLNVTRKLADHLLHAGIIAEICLGMVYGAPLAGILPAEWENTFTVLGYLGLIGIIFEGGLSTNLSLLLKNLPLSTLCAATGITLPVALSFALLAAGYGYTSLEAFAAGAALSSTSLGTTLMALNSVGRVTQSRNVNRLDTRGQEKTTNPEVNQISVEQDEASLPPLQHTRIGTVLISAAVIDDVIGLVLSSLIPPLAILQNSSHTLGSPQNTNIAWTVVRPLLSSFLMATITPLVARFVLKPLFWWRGVGERWCAPSSPGKPCGFSRSGLSQWLGLHSNSISEPTGDVWGTEEHADAVKVTVSVLFVSAFSSIAYYTGSSVLFGAYLAGLTLTYVARPPELPGASDQPTEERVGSESNDTDRTHALSFAKAYGRMIGPLQNLIFAPLFFASIGYAIPFISLWKPAILWRGVLYALLMTIGKLGVCLPILLWTIAPKPYRLRLPKVIDRFIARMKGNCDHVRPAEHPTHTDARRQSLRSALAPAAFMGIAMVSRGEIGLLIAQIARNGTHAGDDASGGLLGDEAFLVCVWAILLCTLVGPIGVGFLVRRWEGSIRRGIWG